MVASSTWRPPIAIAAAFPGARNSSANTMNDVPTSRSTAPATRLARYLPMRYRLLDPSPRRRIGDESSPPRRQLALRAANVGTPRVEVVDRPHHVSAHHDA